MRPVMYLVSITILVMLLSPCEAAPIRLGVGDAAQFNLLTQRNANLSRADSQGAIAVGGNAEIHQYDVGTLQLSNIALQVDGDLIASGDQIVKGDAIVKGTYSNVSSSTWHQPVPSWRHLHTDGGIDIDETYQALSTFARALADLAPNTTAFKNATTLELSAQNTLAYNDNLFVAGIHLSDLNDLSGLSGKAFQNDDFLVLNIFSEKQITVNTFDVQPSLPTWSNVLFNFVDAEAITFTNGNIQGHVLATKADFTFQTGLITGGVYAKSFTSTKNAQLNFNGGFEGEILSNAAEVPEPSTFGIVALVLAVLFAAKPLREHIFGTA
jgi:choice-of-anchor A domain-containing protein